MKLSPFPKVLLLLAISALFIGCAEEKEDPIDASVADGAVYKIPVEDLKTGQRLAKNAEISCEPGSECSPTVGLLGIAYDDTQAGQCSASLIGEDTIVTNSHCVPEDLKKVGASCDKRIWLHFVNDSRYESVLECEKVLAVSTKPGNTSSPDYAVLKMKTKSSRPTFRFSRAGFQNNEVVKLHKVDPIRKRGKIAGELGTAKCTTKYNTHAVEMFFDPYAEVGLFVDCKVIQGNSGGPIQAQDGTIRGVIFAFLVHDFIREKMALSPFTQLDGELNNLNLGTNFACLDDGYFGNAPSICNESKVLNRWAEVEKLKVKRAADEFSTVLYRELPNYVSADLQEKLSFAPIAERFGEATWELRAGVEVKMQVVCVKKNIGEVYSFTLQLPKKWTVIEKFNRNLEPRLSLQREETLEAKKGKLTRIDSKSYRLEFENDSGTRVIQHCLNYKE